MEMATKGPTIEEIILDKIMVTKGIEIEVLVKNIIGPSPDI